MIGNVDWARVLIEYFKEESGMTKTWFRRLTSLAYTDKSDESRLPESLALLSLRLR